LEYDLSTHHGHNVSSSDLLVRRSEDVPGENGQIGLLTHVQCAGQIVVLTNPEIGNYGANQGDQEAARPYIEGLVVREFSSIANNWRSEENAERFLAETR
jgi:carbamoylphosphate synthase small subunit